MSTSKHIDKICITVVAITLVITLLFMFCGPSVITASAKTMPYESTLFDTSYVHSIDIVMDDWDTFIENCESEEYTMCTVVIDGDKYSNIAMRAKGNTSLSTVSSLGSQRYSFKLEFDHYDSTQTLDGLDKLCLNNLIQDNTMMKDYIVYRLMYEFGVDAPLCSYAYLTVNGEDWGLYLAVEGIEDSFLSRNYGSDIGDLYKPDSMSFGGGKGNGKGFDMADFDFSEFENVSGDESETSTEQAETGETGTAQGDTGFGGGMPGNMGGGNMGDFDPSSMGGSQGGNMPGGFNMGDMSDFDPSSMEGFDPSSMEDLDFGDFDPTEIAGDISTGMGSDDVKLKYIDDEADSYSNIFDNAKTDVTTADQKRLIRSLKNLSEYTDLEDTVDIEEVIRYFVVHNFVCNGDSYTGSMIHNYYLYEDDGVLSMIPWDYNLAFGTFQGNNASSTVNTSIDSPVSNVDDRPMLGWIFSDDEYTELYHELFAEFLEEWFVTEKLDRLISDTAEMISEYVDKDPTKFCTTEEFEAGVEALTEFVDLRAQAVRNQLNGDDTEIDTGDLNLTDMGTMNNTGGGMDIPSMPDGTDFGGEIPSMPDGTDFDGEIPEKPDGTAEGQTVTDNTTETADESQSVQDNTSETAAESQTIPDNTAPTTDSEKIIPGGNASGDMPAMPDNADGGIQITDGQVSGDMPSMPDDAAGAPNSGEVPEIPDNSSQTAAENTSTSDGTDETTSEAETASENPSETSAESEISAEGQNGNADMPTPPDGNGEAMQMPNGETMQKPDGEGMDGQFPSMEQSGTNTLTTVILISASAVLLLLGILIAAKKKY